MDFGIREGRQLDFGDLPELAFAGRPGESDAGRDFVHAPAQVTPHIHGVDLIGRLAEAAVFIEDDGVGADDDGARVLAGDVLCLGEGEALGIDEAIAGEEFVYVGRDHGKAIDEGGEELTAAG